MFAIRVESCRAVELLECLLLLEEDAILEPLGVARQVDLKIQPYVDIVSSATPAEAKRWWKIYAIEF